MTSPSGDTRSDTLAKPILTAAEAVEGIADGSVVFVGGWGGVGVPHALLTALAATSVSGLVVVTNNCGMGQRGDVGVLFEAGRVRKAITSFPIHPAGVEFRDALARDEVEVDLVPQGTLVERMRAAGAGLGGFFTPTSAGTPLGEGKEERTIDGRLQVFETALHGDVALVHGHRADTYGNLRYRYAAGAFNSTMAMAAKRVIVEVDELASEPLDPEQVDTAGIFVDSLTVIGAS
jgi:3-oxoadipate CoA-transferase, alpha subunit